MHSKTFLYNVVKQLQSPNNKDRILQYYQYENLHLEMLRILPLSYFNVDDEVSAFPS